MFYRGLCIVNSYSHNKNNDYKIYRLEEEFKKYHISLETKESLSLVPLVIGNETKFNSELPYDFAIYLDKDKYLAKALSFYLPLYNSFESLLLSDDKMQSLLALNQSGVKAPLTIPSPLCYLDQVEEEKEETFLSFLEKQLSYPMVFKENYGSLGKQVFLIHHRDELKQVYQTYRRVPHLYEQFLSKHQGHDYRFIVVDGEVIAVMLRVNNQDFRSNIALGGKGFDATDDVPLSYKNVAIRAAKTLKLDYAGIDIAIDDNENPLFLEANGNAFFTEIEKVTKKNIASFIVGMIYRKVYTK